MCSDCEDGVACGDCGPYTGAAAAMAGDVCANRRRVDIAVRACAGRYLLIANYHPVCSMHGHVVSYGRREDAERMLPYWRKRGVIFSEGSAGDGA